MRNNFFQPFFILEVFEFCEDAEKFVRKKLNHGLRLNLMIHLKLDEQRDKGVL